MLSWVLLQKQWSFPPSALNKPTQITRLWSASLLSLSLAAAITSNTSLFQTSSTFAEPFYTPLQILQRTRRNHEIIRLCLYIPRSVVRSSIVCLQGLCRSVCFTTLLIAQPLVVFMWSLHAAHSEPNTAGRSRFTLNRIVLAAKGDSANAKSQMWETYHFPRGANQIRTGEAGSKVLCLTAWR